MIDKKKIEDAAQKHILSEYQGTLAYEWDLLHDRADIRAKSKKSDFKAGASWAMQEYKKSLWHDASEKPKVDACVVVIMLRGSEQLCKLVSNFENWKTDAETQGYTKWCCLEDILPDTVWEFF